MHYNPNNCFPTYLRLFFFCVEHMFRLKHVPFAYSRNHKTYNVEKSHTKTFKIMQIIELCISRNGFKTGNLGRLRQFVSSCLLFTDL